MDYGGDLAFVGDLPTFPTNGGTSRDATLQHAVTRFESALPSRTIDNQFDESFEWHIMDSGASVDQHAHHVYVTEDAIAHKILVETAGNETLSNQSKQQKT